MTQTSFFDPQHATDTYDMLTDEEKNVANCLQLTRIDGERLTMEELSPLARIYKVPEEYMVELPGRLVSAKIIRKLNGKEFVVLEPGY